MKSSEETKNGLECCVYGTCGNGCMYYERAYPDCMVNIVTDAFALVQQLEADKVKLLEEGHEIRKDMIDRIKQLEADNAQLNRCIENLTDKLNTANDEVAELQAERDALLLAVKKFNPCTYCKNLVRHGGDCAGGRRCEMYRNTGFEFEWRGAQQEDKYE